VNQRGEPRYRDALSALDELATALERHGFRIQPTVEHDILDFPYVRVVRGPTTLPVVTFGNFSPAVARRLAAILNNAPATDSS
jgi:hypothetical protein